MSVNSLNSSVRNASFLQNPCPSDFVRMLKKSIINKWDQKRFSGPSGFAINYTKIVVVVSVRSFRNLDGPESTFPFNIEKRFLLTANSNNNHLTSHTRKIMPMLNSLNTSVISMNRITGLPEVRPGQTIAIGFGTRHHYLASQLRK